MNQVIENSLKKYTKNAFCEQTENFPDKIGICELSKKCSTDKALPDFMKTL